jgi:hypothetical protein
MRSSDSVVAIAFCAITGCATEFGEVKGETDPPSSTGDTGCAPDLRQVNCGEATCVETVFVSGYAISCFRTFAANPNDPQWIVGTPALVTEQCVPDSNECYVVVNAAAAMDLVNECGCIDLCDADESLSTCCEWGTPPEEDLAWDGPEDELFIALASNSNCAIPFSPEYGQDFFDATCESPSIPTPEILEDACVPEMLLWSPGAAFHLEVSPVSSYITLDAGPNSFTTAVSGNGVVGSNPAQFLTGFFWVEDSSLDGAALNDWVFAFSHAIDLNVQTGYFVVPASELNQSVFRGSGLIGTTEMRARVRSNTPAYGALNFQTGHWVVNFTQTTTGGSLQVHLTGPFQVAE